MSTTGLWDGFVEGEEPLLSFTVKDRDTGDVLDLTNATVTLKSWFDGETALIIDGSATVDSDPTTGLFSYQVSTGEFARVGRHYMEIKIAYSGGETRKILLVFPIKEGAPS